MQWVELPPKVKPIGCKWIFERKLQLNGIINKYKACFVVKRYKQNYHVDYLILILQLLKLHIHEFYVIAFIYKLIVYQIDVKNSLLNDDLEEETYME